MHDVLLVCPQERDRREVAAAGLAASYRVHEAGDDLDATDAFDPTAFLDDAARVPADGVVGTKDRSALLASLLAARRGLPGPAPAAMLACQHKPTSRTLQQAAVPAWVPRFALVDGSPPPFPPPWIVKPVVGRLSHGVHRIDNEQQLAELPPLDDYRRGYGAIAAHAGLDPAALRGHLAEEVASGDEVTLEGFVHDGRVTVIGVTDSVMYPGTASFERFEYPSRLPEARQDELAGVAHRVLPALRFDGGFFNLELLVPPSGPATLIEVNGRIASQFAPLVRATHGRSTYDALFALACGRDPAWSGRAPDGVAVSYVVRTFADALVLDVPEDDESTEVLVRPGRRLSEQGTNDTGSYRLAILYGAGETREDALALCRERAAALSFRLEPSSPR